MSVLFSPHMENGVSSFFSPQMENGVSSFFSPDGKRCHGKRDGKRCQFFFLPRWKTAWDGKRCQFFFLPRWKTAWDGKRCQFFFPPWENGVGSFFPQKKNRHHLFPEKRTDTIYSRHHLFPHLFPLTPFIPPIGWVAAWLERRRGWDIAAFLRGALIGLVISSLLSIVAHAAWGGAEPWFVRWIETVVSWVGLILGGLFGLSRLKSRRPGREGLNE